MAKIYIPYFLPIDPFNHDEEYTGGLTLRGEEVMLDINIDGPWIEPYRLEAIKKFVGRVVSMDEQNRKRLYDDYISSTDNMVHYYLQFHLEKIWRNTLEKIVDFNNKDISPIDQLFKRLHLIRIGFYPEKDDLFAIFDYCIHADYTEYVIVVNYNLEGALQEMTMEL